jgi:hypothetical protein
LHRINNLLILQLLYQEAPKKTLKSRDFTIDFTKKLGTTQLVNQSDALNSAGFFCEVCNCKIRDSSNYFDHINGVKRMYFSFHMVF